MPKSYKSMLDEKIKELNLSDEQIQEIFNLEGATTDKEKYNVIMSYLKEEDEEEEEVSFEEVKEVKTSRKHVHLDLAKELDEIQDKYYPYLKRARLEETIPAMVSRIKSFKEMNI